MALQYKIVSTYRPGEGKSGQQLWFPKLSGSEQITLREVARILQSWSTASEADVYLIVKGLVTLIPRLLTDGKTVKLDELGTFRLHARVNTSDSPEAVTAKNIRELRISFRPDKQIKKQLKNVNFEKVK